MPNMSYCRFQNTLEDLRDCYDNWPNDKSKLSLAEVKAKDRLIKLCQMIVQDFED